MADRQQIREEEKELVFRAGPMVAFTYGWGFVVRKVKCYLANSVGTSLEEKKRGGKGKGNINIPFLSLIEKDQLAKVNLYCKRS